MTGNLEFLYKNDKLDLRKFLENLMVLRNKAELQHER